MDPSAMSTVPANGLIEFVLFGGWVWFWLLVGIFVIVAVAAEEKEYGYGAFFGFVAVCILLNWGGEVQWSNIFTFQNVSLYLGIGLVFAGIRSIFLGRKKSREKQKDWASSEHKDYPLSLEDKELFKKSSYYKSLIENIRLKDHFFRWWFNWPFSGLWWALSDWLTEFWHLVKGFYERLYKWGVDAAI